MKAYQVLNEFGNPSSSDDNELAIHATYDSAIGWKDYLQEECSRETSMFTIRELVISLPLEELVDECVPDDDLFD